MYNLFGHCNNFGVAGVWVARQGVTEKKVLANCVEKMGFSNAKILGFVINGIDLNNNSGSKYKYNYKYREEYK